VYKYVYPLSRIHKTSLVSVYFGLNQRSESVDYLFIYILMEITGLWH
jgi:hypothetical protein